MELYAMNNIERTKELLILNGHYVPNDSVKFFDISTNLIPMKLPLYSCKISAGFPSPADDHLEKKLDLNSHLIKHPAATFFVRVNGDSMINAGINDNDILIVDRSLKPSHGKIVIAVVDGQMTVKRLHKRSGKLILMPENNHFKPIEITESMTVEIWGVVVTSIHSVC
tara:strand:- start:1077 stop:1580 length:504 start_codon:yes stop_codon:yes gene_type:complete